MISSELYFFNDTHLQTLSDIFQMARARAETLLQGGGGGGEDEEEGVMRFLQVWMSFCLHQDARTALQNEEVNKLQYLRQHPEITLNLFLVFTER